MNKITLPIKGMHCRSCEILIEDKIKEIPEVKNVHVSYKKSQVDVYSKNLLDINLIKLAIIEAGYEVGTDDSRSWISLNPKEYIDLLISGIFLFFLYLIAKKLGIINISAGSGNPSNLLVVLLIGLTAGVSTCMALVGGLILGVSARFSEKHPNSSAAQKFRPHLYFTLGRICSYFLLGGIIGSIGKAFQLSGSTLGILMILVGFVMFAMGLQLTGLFPRLSNGGVTLPNSIGKFLGIKKHKEKEYSHVNSILVGALTFFLPCGFTQAMQLYAMSTGSFLSGALIMGAFALGTAPGLLGIGGLTSVLKGSFAKKFFKFTGILVTTLAIFNISNGYNLTGWKIALSSSNNSVQVATDDPNVRLENGVQVVNMDQVGGGYRPNKFTIKKGIPVRWIINAKSPDACSASILATKIGVRKILSPGENEINFTPSEAGTIKFSCLMGMYTGTFNVIDDGPVSDSDTLTAKPKEAKAPADTTPGQTDNSSQKTPVVPTPAPKSAPLPTTSQPVTPTPAPVEETQIIKATFESAEKDIQPSTFKVSVGKPVKFEIDIKNQAFGCMSSITLPGLDDHIYNMTPGRVVFNFTPEVPGDYDITCAMGISRGLIEVI